MLKLNLQKEKIDHARELARDIADTVQNYIVAHTTDSVERTTLRLMGLDGVNDEGIVWPNILGDHLKPLLSGGACRPVFSAMISRDLDIDALAAAVNEKQIDLCNEPILPMEKLEAFANECANKAIARIDSTAWRRKELVEKLGDPQTPWLYVIVATGNIHEDLRQAQMAARQGADVVAVIRSTIQSLLDYVPFGITTEGYGGTYATQENFKLMREGLDEVGEEVGRYIRLVNYASGLCMPEIAAMGAVERLDMMLNDSMYGILFRDINPNRTFVDQYTSRLLSARAKIIINTGEDNYLTTADAVEDAHTVLASCLINERFAELAGLSPELMGLGHAFEINPEIEDQLSLEIAHALLIREIFPEHPLKYMPPTKYMTGDIFRGYQMNAYFNLVGALTHQGIQLLGMLTEAMHTPYLMDRALAVQNAKYAFNAARHLSDSFDLKSDGPIALRATEVLDKALEMMEHIADIGLFAAVEKGLFADIKRPRTGGKGADGVYAKSPEYWNPILDALAEN